MVSDFQWGTSAAQPVTLSFIVLANSITGTFSGSIRNAANTRSYPFTYSIPVAGASTRISITIPGDTAGTWVMSGNAGSVIVGFDLGTGATYRGPAGVWAGTQYNGATGAVNVVGTNPAAFFVTGVKLEIGTVATPYNRQSLAKSMADCQRYFQTNLAGINTTGAAGQPIGSTQLFPVQMRAAPTIVYSGTSSGNTTGLPTSNGGTNGYVWPQMTATAAGYAWFYTVWTASAEL